VIEKGLSYAKCLSGTPQGAAMIDFEPAALSLGRIEDKMGLSP
jgi:hypothetical protein